MGDHRQAMEHSATDILATRGYAELRCIHCEFQQHDHVLTLRGRVSRYYLKQLAQEIVKSLDGVDQVVNLIQVLEH